MTDPNETFRGPFIYIMQCALAISDLSGPPGPPGAPKNPKWLKNGAFELKNGDLYEFLVSGRIFLSPAHYGSEFSKSGQKGKK